MCRAGRVLLILVVVAAAACSERSAHSLLTPTSTSAAPTTSPDGAPITIIGRIRESAPTQAVGVWDATVRVADGPDAGRMAITDSFGFYRLAGLQPGRFTVAVSADGFIEGKEVIAAHSNTKLDVVLTPVPRTVTHTSTGSIAAGDGTCSDGMSPKPCRILMVPVHNDGSVSATLTWVCANGADLDLTLFKTGEQRPIARSNGSGAGPEQVTAVVSGGSTYEFRMTWAAGSGSAQYVLEVSYPY
jgi:carboxypeptidase family protein